MTSDRRTLPAVRRSVGEKRPVVRCRWGRCRGSLCRSEAPRVVLLPVFRSRPTRQDRWHAEAAGYSARGSGLIWNRTIWLVMPLPPSLCQFAEES